jgi:cytochrome c5
LTCSLQKSIQEAEFPIVDEETEWHTFRDSDPTTFESIYTGIKAVPLKGHWMDLGDDGNLLPHLQVETER